jgi:hypothetical protein
MNSYKKNAVIAGVLFLTAMAASLLGGGLIESVLTAPDYITNISSNTSTIFAGVFLEFINAAAVVGIAVILFPVLKKYNESFALGYVSFRIIESIFCIAGAVIPLILIYLEGKYSETEAFDVNYFKTLIAIFISIRSDLAEIVIPIVFSLGAFLFYHILYHSKLVPRFISVWGLIGALLIFTLVFLQINMIINIIFVLPIILNEIFLGIWLIVKGFNLSVIDSRSVDG